MKRYIIVGMLAMIGLTGVSQVFNPNVDEVIQAVELDSLVMFVRNLTGEDPVMVNGNLVTIEHRVSSWGNNLAADYIKQVLEDYGLTTYDQVYSAGGRNIYAIQPGTTYPDQFYIICAHYDAVDFYCADDNASGSAGVLEAARLLSGKTHLYSIIYALWDEEEIGLVGSGYFAQQASINGDDILAVINMDMIAWDSDEDMVAEIHSNNPSMPLANYVVAIDNLYDLATNPVIKNPGTGASDHARFWNYGYQAVLMIEEYYGGDFNPYYHSENDRINIFNLPYFHEMAKLAIGTLVSYATPVDFGVGIAENTSAGVLSIRNYPNPFSGSTVIGCELNRNMFLDLTLVNGLGKVVSVVASEELMAGKYEFTLSSDGLPAGLYFLVSTTIEGTVSHKIMIK